ncbi:hypothetical protein [Labrenzia sp. DG1229]|uniref:hypothetical protein n=1 Tax=Labrenzia sp. DG1229 TaxID=681847 RepID=UPI000A74B61F|nr:hypothetical protein [Labrenzia sp. DG1229]
MAAAPMEGESAKDTANSNRISTHNTRFLTLDVDEVRFCKFFRLYFLAAFNLL